MASFLGSVAEDSSIPGSPLAGFEPEILVSWGSGLEVGVLTKLTGALPSRCSGAITTMP